MAVASDRPYGAFRFDVSVARRRVECSAVVLPRLDVGDGPVAPSDDVSPYLVLRRGFCGTLDLYEWWQAECGPKRSRGKRVNVDLLDEHGRAVTRWQFDGCRPVALDYSPLDANTSTLVVESVTLTFDALTMS